MALIHTLEKNGNFLFKNRGQFPVFLFLTAIPVIYFTDYSFISPVVYSVLTAISIALSFLGFCIRSLSIATSKKNTSGRNADKQIAESLNTTGIYSTVRHPLYLGNYFMWIGIAVFTFNLWFIIIISLLFWVYYERIMFAEERFLEKKFGDKYLDWAKNIPPFWPSLKQYEKNEVPFSLKTVLRREYSGVTATMFGFFFVDFLRNLFLADFQFHWYLSYTIILIVAILISLVFRSLKHYTNLLKEDNRT